MKGTTRWKTFSAVRAPKRSDDPEVFAQPWKIAYRIWQRAPEEYVLFEYACHKGNRSMDLTSPLISDTAEQP